MNPDFQVYAKILKFALIYRNEEGTGLDCISMFSKTEFHFRFIHDRQTIDIITKKKMETFSI
jgi:hypothetical protein